jgi:hypothetical protein
MASDKKMLAVAAETALSSTNTSRDRRVFLLGAVGQRNDGVYVMSRNVASTDVVPSHHAEARLTRKLTPDSTVWVARVRRKNGEWALSRPCNSCQAQLQRAGVRRVVYTIGPNEWGVIDL